MIRPIRSHVNHQRQSSSSSIDTNLTEDPLLTFDSLSHSHKISRSTFINNNQTKCLTVHFHRINERFIKIDFQLQPFDIYLEDQYIYDLLKIFSQLLPLDLNVPINVKEDIPQINMSENQQVQTPFVCESLCIGPINLIFSIHASVKVYIGCHQLSMFIDKFQKNYIYSANKQLLTLITRHYIFSLLTRSPVLLGSFDLLGKNKIL